MKILITICSRNPTENLIECCRALIDKQIKNDSENEYKIIIIDSNSSQIETYKKISEIWSDIQVIFAKNNNYEWGAYKYAYDNFPNFDYYFCIQDTIIFLDKVELSMLSNNTVYSIFHNSGFHSHPSIIGLATRILEQCNLNDYLSIIRTTFILAQHCSFIVSREILIDIFNTLTIPPCNKDGSCAYERLFGMYFIMKKIKTIDINSKIKKIHGRRI